MEPEEEMVSKRVSKKVVQKVAPALLGALIFLKSSPLLIFHPVEAPTDLPDLLPAGELFVVKNSSFHEWRVDGISLTPLKEGRLLGATTLKQTHVEITALRTNGKTGVDYFRKRIPLTFRPHQTRHQALRIPATTWAKLQSDSTKELRAAQRKRFDQIVRSSPEDATNLCWSPPIKSRITSHFGKARVLPNGEMYHHTGTDYAARTGTPILPAAQGEVALSDDFVVSGGFVVLYHGYNLATTYAHLSRRDVQVGDRLTATMSLGLSGATGRVTGPHLHWEMFWRDRPVDPDRATETLRDLCDPA